MFLVLTLAYVFYKLNVSFSVLFYIMVNNFKLLASFTSIDN